VGWGNNYKKIQNQVHAERDACGVLADFQKLSRLFRKR
jgi:hypothetical protein